MDESGQPNTSIRVSFRLTADIQNRFFGSKPNVFVDSCNRSKTESESRSQNDRRTLEMVKNGATVDSNGPENLTAIRILQSFTCIRVHTETINHQ